MRVLVGMSGGVDSSVAAALLVDAGHDVVGCTMRLWGGESDTGCCSVADVDDARRVAQQLGIDHVVFNFADDFTAGVVEPYLDDHAAGRTPNPCIECNRSIKFDRLLRRAHSLGFEAVATGHHARVERRGGGFALRRGVDAAKDQSYVLYVLGQPELARVLLPIGDLTKAEVRASAAALGLRTATKPESQDLCFVATTVGRAGFVGARLPLTPGRVVDLDGAEVGTVDAVELVTVGQRRGLGIGGGNDEPRFAVDVDLASATVTVGRRDDLLTAEIPLERLRWVDAEPPLRPVLVQASAHGTPLRGRWDPEGATVHLDEPARRVAPGQSAVLYDGDEVLGGGVARR